MAQKVKQKKKGGGCLRIVLIILAIPFILFFGLFAFTAVRSFIDTDEKFLQSYRGTPDIVDIAERLTLTEKGKAVLYRADPQLVDAQNFTKYCQVKKGGVEPLACVAPNPERGPFAGRQIFLLRIDDPEFADHKYAASAHEMLHQAYKKIRSSKREQLNALLNQELSKRQGDPHLAAVIDILLKQMSKDTDDVNSELHSKFGVEYSDISPELEKHYRQYFTDRQKVVQLYRGGGVNSRVRQIDALNAELTSLNNQLTSLKNQLTSYKNSGDIDSYNNLLPQFNSLVSQFNAKVAKLNRIHSEIQEFYSLFKPDYQPPQEIK